MAEPPPAPQIQRTMRLLATSTPERRNRVRILVYGQSVSAQAWWLRVKENLEQRFPYADLHMENRSIGGFSSQWLVHTAEHDLYPFYADLVIFRVLGDHHRYEDIIARTRSRTTAEMLIWNGSARRPTQKTPAPDKQDWNQFFNYEWVPRMCAKYHCAFVDTGTEWDQYMMHYGLPYLDFVVSETDGHLNANGNWVHSELIKRRLAAQPGLSEPKHEGMVRDIAVGKEGLWKDGKLVVEFEGNRVDLVTDTSFASSSGTAAVRVDGRRPSEIPELYVHSRCGGAIGTGWPCAIEIGHEAPLMAEDWTMRFSHVSDDSSLFRFELQGSQTGPDGGGDSQTRFVSNSGRVVIEPEQWIVGRDYNLRNVPMPEGYKANWRVATFFSDTFAPPENVDPAREHVVTVAQGLTNTRHTLELTIDGDAAALKTIRIYRPPCEDGARDE